VIFTALGLLVLAGALLIAGVAKSSVLLLMLSLVTTIGACAVLALTYSVARRTGLTTGGIGPAMPAGAGLGAPPMSGDPNTATVVMYVPVDQLPSITAPKASGANGIANGNGKGAPISDYDAMTAEQVVKLITSGALNEAQLQAVRDYEAAHAARKTVLDRVDKVLYRA
jgi:hypothetical protein